MGVIYSVLPVNRESRPWLEELGIVATGPDSRNPLIGEIYGTLNHLNGISYQADPVRIGDSWNAQISDNKSPSQDWTRLTILQCRAPSQPQDCHFSKGSPRLIIQVVSALSDRCGALVLSRDGENAFLISPNSDPAELCRNWLDTHQPD